MSASHSDTSRPLARPPVLRGLAVVLARARFILVVGVVLAVIGAWPTLRNYWDKYTRSAPPAGVVSGDTEYWCPMCPGVVSDWPSKCPVCSMTLVRRKKGEMTPLPDGVVARVQLSPYRVQLAGVHTSPVEYRRLEHEVTVAGRLEAAPVSAEGRPGLVLAADVSERDARLLRIGQESPVSCDESPGETYPGRVIDMTPAGPPAGGQRVRVWVNNARGELRPGRYATTKYRTPVAELEASRRLLAERWRDRTAVEIVARALSGPGGPPTEGPLAALLDGAVAQAAAGAGLTLAVPEAAVIDTGERRVVYLETMSGMFDAVEVVLGRRYGDHYPVRSGLGAGQRVVTAGAVLLDAETRLNPSVAASYFGAGARRATPAPAEPVHAGPSPLSPEDRRLIERQKVCPVTGESLNAMGGPVRVIVDGRTVFVCCAACEKPIRKNPQQYLSKLPP